ncbi:lysine methyltransferase [Nitzschia inconspicua]|uniref:Lysine methyltransferase n=1 Tax=Nitzschia inconspicua TaxID=303405 RepID=A0A9K3LGY0_9STRA|nr:lysine methyltransferase [Nitzschia inconspicua]
MSLRKTSATAPHLAVGIDTKKYILAMASIEEVIEHFRIVETFDDKYQQQNAFAHIVESCWNEFGPSQRYLKRLVLQYVNQLEREGEAAESDALSELVLHVSLRKDNVPESNESCYLSFQIPEKEGMDDSIDGWLRIRVFPYHNDVALRLWEAGAALAEYFLDHPFLLKNMHVIELGAGVGLTGLVIAACCNPSSVYLTDYTDVCRNNLRHNLEINRKWLARHGVSSDQIAEGYLEWESFAHPTGLTVNEMNDDPAMVSFQRAQVLIAADVLYDVSVIDSLVLVVKRFLTQQSNRQRKEVIFAITRRNMNTFNLFLDHLRGHGIHCTYLAKSCENLIKMFPCNFFQGREDVQVAQLRLTAFHDDDVR